MLRFFLVLVAVNVAKGLWTATPSIDAVLPSALTRTKTGSPITEPYPLINPNFNTGKSVEASPDPLVSYQWPPGYNMTGLQIYETTRASNWTATPEGAFSGLDSLRLSSPTITFKSAGVLRLDFGFEHAAWFEFTSADLGAGATNVQAAISEYNEPWQVTSV